MDTHALEWMHENYLNTLDPKRVDYLRNATANLVFSNDDEQWAGLLARTITAISPIEVDVLLKAWALRGAAARGTHSGYTPHMVFEDRVAEEYGPDRMFLVSAAIRSLVGRGLLRDLKQHSGNNSMSMNISEFGMRLVALVRGEGEEDPRGNG